MKLVLSVGLVPDLKKDMIEPLYDYMKILNLFKDKYKPIVWLNIFYIYNNLANLYKIS